MPAFLSYVLVTPARNEAAFIELTLRSMIAQSVKPLKWVIVSDGSTDATDEIVSSYAAAHSWIEVLRMPERTERHFSGKVKAFEAGYERLKHLPYNVVGSLDADLSFGEDYFSFLLEKLAGDPKLGVVGTPFAEKGKPVYDYRFVNIEHVSGACQVFRRECFEEIGGYVPVKGGGIDYIAVTTARMKGWKTRTFTEQCCLHHRQIGTAQHSALQVRFRDGAKDYALGNHPLWELFRAAYQLQRPPLITGAMLLFCGYVWALITRRKRPVSHELLSFTRSEQMRRLKRHFIGRRAPAAGPLVSSS
jgi:poly-beta-1,6-N-acetyl-D-glucosamine synthase